MFPPLFLVKGTDKVLTTISADADVYIGESAILKCQYSGVTDSSSLVVKWERRTRGNAQGHAIWIYKGISGLNTGHEHEGKFEKIKTDVTKEHTIRLNDADLDDEGIYFCNMEYYIGSSYLEGTAKTIITIIGIKAIIIHVVLLFYIK